ncbi:putative membrane protein YdjX (TVP38/TMEM64 family) [Oikeobacillus pervagus]|uniref:Membrane protein YdjX (TVP38/TMEM64 family) n=1 Tax=Oikeobacillus pervagus TaxID=1325931 RepID=A0AAJ1SZ14_9BACI|nr:TVP38/TMEM64 family protein [Oikeobacillus pervagus]MDQ0215464.1 putative membrane protein YdjX (TVP38/TMEM64 family) [Oikeobacillus pervagus]
MDQSMYIFLAYVEAAGMFAPIAFILLHFFRQFLFIPVALVCMTGGILFGSLFGMIYSLIGLIFVSLFFYVCLSRMPKTNEKLLKIKKKWFGPHAKLTVGQITVLRLFPFVHYHLLNVCLMERSPRMKDFIRNSFIVNFPFVFFYTIFGEFLSQFTLKMIVLMMIGLFILFYLLRERVIILKWHDFFQTEKKRSFSSNKS